MEKLRKGWDLARQDLLGQYLNNSAALTSAGIFAKEMHWNIKLCVILFSCFCLLCELVEIHEWHWWRSTLTPPSLDTFQRSQHAYIVFTADPLLKDLWTYWLHHASSREHCKGKNTPRIVHVSKLINENPQVLKQTLWVTKDSAMPVMTTHAWLGMNRHTCFSW